MLRQVDRLDGVSLQTLLGFPLLDDGSDIWGLTRTNEIQRDYLGLMIMRLKETIHETKRLLETQKDFLRQLETQTNYWCLKEITGDSKRLMGTHETQENCTRINKKHEITFMVTTIIDN